MANAIGSNNALGAGRVEQTSSAGRMGQAVGDAASTVQGTTEALFGGGVEGVGLALDSTGVGAVLGVPLNVAGAGIIAHGTTTAVVGGIHLAQDSSKGSGSSNEKGSYTNTHESGKTYNGKGDRARSQQSGRNIEKKTGDKHTATEFKPSANDREAFKDESRRIDANGGPKSDTNHNKIDSPGANYRKRDGSN